MPEVTMRQLKQNPQEVVNSVLTDRIARPITSHGHDTGVVIQIAPNTATPQKFVSGATLARLAAASPLTEEQAQAWKDDIDAVLDDAPVDPWSDAQA